MTILFSSIFFHDNAYCQRNTTIRYPNKQTHYNSTFRYKNAASSLFMQGFIYHNSLSDLQMAEKLYLKFLDEYPDHELALSVRWELDNLGKNIDEIPFFKN